MHAELLDSIASCVGASITVQRVLCPRNIIIRIGFESDIK